MARFGLNATDKFKRLRQRLNAVVPGFGELLARGALETLWSTSYEIADDHLGDPEAVELKANWPGQPGMLFEALLTAGGRDGRGFIEEDPERGGYRIHDWWVHIPDSVRKRAAREAERQAKGQSLSDVRRAAGARGAAAKAAAANGGHLPATGQQMNAETGQKCLPGEGRDGEGWEGEREKPRARDPGATAPGAEQRPTNRHDGNEGPTDRHDAAPLPLAVIAPAPRDVAPPPPPSSPPTAFNAGDVERIYAEVTHKPIHPQALKGIAEAVAAEALAASLDGAMLFRRCLAAWPEYRAHVRQPAIAWNPRDDLIGIEKHIGHLLAWVIRGEKPVGRTPLGAGVAQAPASSVPGAAATRELLAQRRRDAAGGGS